MDHPGSEGERGKSGDPGAESKGYRVMIFFFYSGIGHFWFNEFWFLSSSFPNKNTVRWQNSYSAGSYFFFVYLAIMI